MSFQTLTEIAESSIDEREKLGNSTRHLVEMRRPQSQDSAPVLCTMIVLALLVAAARTETGKVILSKRSCYCHSIAAA